jgi:RNA polymerase sigma-70 factor, ECF subfamily
VGSDAERFHELYEVHFHAVSRYARARADPDMAKDATAQTFLVAWRRRAEFFDARHPLGWLLGVTRRTLAGERRAASRQSGLRDRVSAAVAPLPRDPAALVTERDAIAAAFSRLRHTDREVLALIAWDNLSPDEAAEVLGCSRAAFAVKLHRARSRLRVQLRLLDADDPPAPRTSRVLTSLITAERNDS